MKDEITEKNQDDVYNNYLKVAFETIIQQEVMKSAPNNDIAVKVMKKLKENPKYDQMLTKKE